MTIDARDPIKSNLDMTERGSGLGHWLIGLISIMVLAAFAGILWYIYDQGVDQQAALAPPVIQAPDGPVKVKPEEPGGMQVPNQDKQVYQALEPTRAEPTVEQLLPPPEAPKPEPEQIDRQPEPAAVEVEPPATVAAAETTPPAPEPAVEAPAPEPASPQTSVPEFQYVVQLAAFRSEEPAGRAWGTLRQKYPDILNGMDHRVRKVDLGAKKGVFYRLQAGGFETRTAALAVCDQLKAKKQGCMVVRR